MVRRGYADPECLGIAGASYGGWVTTFAVTQTDIFKAASANDPVVDTGISSAVAYRGNLLSNYWLHAGFVDGHLLDVPFPTSDPRKVKTPILLRFGLKGEPPMPSQFFVSGLRSAEHTYDLQALMRISYAVFCLKKKTKAIH